MLAFFYPSQETTSTHPNLHHLFRSKLENRHERRLHVIPRTLISRTEIIEEKGSQVLLPLNLFNFTHILC